MNLHKKTKLAHSWVTLWVTSTEHESDEHEASGFLTAFSDIHLPDS